MRNGMSVQEIYNKLDHCDRLQTAYCEERGAHFKLRQDLQRARNKIYRTAEDYSCIYLNSQYTREDRVEFRYRAAGLLEAAEIIEKLI